MKPTTNWTHNVKVVDSEEKDLAVALFLSFHDIKAQKGVECKDPENCFMDLIEFIRT